MDILSGIAGAIFWAAETQKSNAAKQTESLKTELAALRRELVKLQGPQALAEQLKLHPSRLPAAKRAARALGIDVAELPDFAKEYDCSVARVVAVWSKKTRAEVLAERANPEAAFAAFQEASARFDQLRR